MSEPREVWVDGRLVEIEQAGIRTYVEQVTATYVDPDWIKTRTWDVRDPQTQEPVTTIAGLRSALGAGLDDGAWRRTLSNLVTLPSWQAAPESLRAEVGLLLA